MYPQGSILGPLHGVARLFADDTNLTFSGYSLPFLHNKMKDLRGIASWLSVRVKPALKLDNLSGIYGLG